MLLKSALRTSIINEEEKALTCKMTISKETQSLSPPKKGSKKIQKEDDIWNKYKPLFEYIERQKAKERRGELLRPLTSKQHTQGAIPVVKDRKPSKMLNERLKEDKEVFAACRRKINESKSKLPIKKKENDPCDEMYAFPKTPISAKEEKKCPPQKDWYLKMSCKARNEKENCIDDLWFNEKDLSVLLFSNQEEKREQETCSQAIEPLKLEAPDQTKGKKNKCDEIIPITKNPISTKEKKRVPPKNDSKELLYSNTNKAQDEKKNPDYEWFDKQYEDQLKHLSLLRFLEDPEEEKRKQNTRSHAPKVVKAKGPDETKGAKDLYVEMHVLPKPLVAKADNLPDHEYYYNFLENDCLIPQSDDKCLAKNENRKSEAGPNPQRYLLIADESGLPSFDEYELFYKCFDSDTESADGAF